MLTGLNATRVLVVDDNRHMRAILKTMLRGFGVGRTIECESGAEALEALGSESVDLIITDHEMPHLTGAAMVAKLRRKEELARASLPVVMVTGHAGASRVFAARDAGVNEFCTKPISPFVLWTKIAATAKADRPFIRTATYVGPCRRRRRLPVAVDRRNASAFLDL